MSNKINLINIFNDKLYKYKNKTYIAFVEKNFKEYEKSNVDDIKIGYFDNYNNSKTCNEIFKITKEGDVIFFHKENLIYFKKERKRFSMNNLLNINIKNQKTYELIKVIEVLQKDYFKSSNLKDLKYISYDDILDNYKMKYNSYLSKSIVSNILNNIYFRNQNNKVLPLVVCVPRKSFILYIKIKCILGNIPYASDKILQKELYLNFGFEISTVQISQIRKKYFIPKKSIRVKKMPYIRFDEHFSLYTPLYKTNINNFHNLKVVYELSITKDVDYSYGKSNIVYIGSSKNLYKRFIEYVNGNGHTHEMKKFFLSNIINFRYIKIEEYLELEKTLLNEFKEIYGSLPLLNKNNMSNFSRFDWLKQVM